MANNQQINWVPEHIKDGRFGNWLENNVDWALGRERYWGTPLPIWGSDAPGSTYMECVGSVAELEEKVGRKLKDLDLHRPYVDELTWTAPDGGTMRRVREVADCWFDCGSMPVAQWHYPFENQEVWQRAVAGRLHLRGDRPDARLVLHAARGQHAALRPAGLSRTSSAWATSWPKTAAR